MILVNTELVKIIFFNFRWLIPINLPVLKFLWQIYHLKLAK